MMKTNLYDEVNDGQVEENQDGDEEIKQGRFHAAKKESINQS